PVGTTFPFITTPAPVTAPYEFKCWIQTNAGPSLSLMHDCTTRPTLLPYTTLFRSRYQIATWVRSSGKTTDTFESTKLTSFAIIAPPQGSLRAVSPDKTA